MAAFFAVEVVATDIEIVLTLPGFRVGSGLKEVCRHLAVLVAQYQRKNNN